MEDHLNATSELSQLRRQVDQLGHEGDHERWTAEGELHPRPAPTPTVERSSSRNHDS